MYQRRSDQRPPYGDPVNPGSLSAEANPRVGPVIIGDPFEPGPVGGPPVADTGGIAPGPPVANNRYANAEQAWYQSLAARRQSILSRIMAERQAAAAGGNVAGRPSVDGLTEANAGLDAVQGRGQQAPQMNYNAGYFPDQVNQNQAKPVQMNGNFAQANADLQSPRQQAVANALSSRGNEVNFDWLRPGTRGGTGVATPAGATQSPQAQGQNGRQQNPINSRGRLF